MAVLYARRLLRFARNDGARESQPSADGSTDRGYRIIVSDNFGGRQGAGAAEFDFHLNCRVTDLKAFRELLANFVKEGVSGVARGHDQMTGQCDFGRAHRPDV